MKGQSTQKYLKIVTKHPPPTQKFSDFSARFAGKMVEECYFVKKRILLSPPFLKLQKNTGKAGTKVNNIFLLYYIHLFIIC